MKYARSIAMAVSILGLCYLSGCVDTVVIDTHQHTHIHTPIQDPLVGTWEMARTTIYPKITAPNLLLNRVIPEKTTWRITRVNGVLEINYDGKHTWYNTLGIDIAKKPIVVTEISSTRACIFESGGSIYMAKLPWITGILLPSSTTEQISVQFDDRVLISVHVAYDPCCQEAIPMDNTLSAIIEVNSQGEYYEQAEFASAELKTFNHSGTIIYRGTRKQ